MSSFNDPIAEFLTKLRNAVMAKQRFTDLELSKMRVSLVDILKKHGFIENFLIDEQKKKMRIFLRYNQNRRSVLQGLKRISSPGCRKYIKSEEIPRVFNNLGISILSTSQGVIEGSEAREKKIGGELLCYIW